MHFDVNW